MTFRPCCLGCQTPVAAVAPRLAHGGNVKTPRVEYFAILQNANLMSELN